MSVGFMLMSFGFFLVYLVVLEYDRFDIVDDLICLFDKVMGEGFLGKFVGLI